MDGGCSRQERNIRVQIVCERSDVHFLFRQNKFFLLSRTFSTGAMPPKFKRQYDHNAGAPERQALLDDQSDDEDFFLRGPSPGFKNDKISRVQGQVEEVIDVMQDNIGKVMDRGQRLEDLQDKSDDLASNADLFRMKARTLSNTMWWRECKMRIILGVVILVIVLIIVVPIIVQQTKP